MERPTTFNVKKIFTQNDYVGNKIYRGTYWLFFLTCIMVKCLYFQFTTQLNVRPFFSSVNIWMAISSFSVLVILTSFVTFFLSRKRFIALFIFDILLSILLAADTNFYRYYYKVFSIPVFMQLDINVISSVDESIMSLFKFKDLVYIIDLPFMLMGLIALRKKGIDKIHIKTRAFTSILILLLASATFLSACGSIDTNDTLNFSNNYLVRNLGVLYAHFNSTKSFIKETFFENKNLSTKEKDSIKSFFDNKTSESKNFNGIAKGKNLIVVQVEAMQQFFINTKINGTEITPNLNKLIKESLYFDNIYYQVAGGNTSDAEFMCNTSLYPAKDGAVYFRFADNYYYSLPKALKQEGYNTYALHAFSSQFWNRTKMYKAIGFDTFVNDSYFVRDDFMGWDGTALSDASFFRQSLDKIDTSKPFYSFFITLSSHHPFTFFKNYDFNAGEFEGTYTGNYIKAASYADKCLGQFIDDLKKRGLYDSSLLMIYGDHGGVTKSHADELMKLLGLEFSETQWTKLQKIPCIIHYPGVKNGEVISTTGGQMDFLPTIANLMGLEYSHAMGKDLLNTSKGYAVLRSGTLITDRYIYLNSSQEAYDVKNGSLIDTSKCREEINSLLQQLYISDLIIQKDGFK